MNDDTEEVINERTRSEIASAYTKFRVASIAVS